MLMIRQNKKSRRLSQASWTEEYGYNPIPFSLLFAIELVAQTGVEPALPLLEKGFSSRN